MSSQLHHVVMCSHSADDFVAFLTDVVGMTIQQQFHVPGGLLESTLGWPPSSGSHVTMLGSGDCGLIEVLDVPMPLREVVREGLAALSFLPKDAGRVRERADASAHDTRSIDIGVPGYQLFFCTVGGVPIEVMGGYPDKIDLSRSGPTSS
jgi:catechol 2,3-dioxygenase-like lactoylglutathione lyase family enzyme